MAQYVFITVYVGETKQDVFVKKQISLWKANSKDGQDHKDKYFDASRKILSREMTICNMREKLVKCQGQGLSTNIKIMHVLQGIFMWNVKALACTHYLKVINKVKVFKK